MIEEWFIMFFGKTISCFFGNIAIALAIIFMLSISAVLVIAIEKWSR